MNKVINIGVIGLGQRGYSILKNLLLICPRYKVVGVCDVYEDRVEQSAKAVEEAGFQTPQKETDYKKLFNNVKMDAVYIATAWEYHGEITLYALKMGVPVAMEVGGAYCEQELWDLVHTTEETKTPLMFMENCCFDKAELMATAMARKGVFGKIVHMAGSYSHDLRKEVSDGNKIRHYRLRNYIHRNCENYPTHEIGPIAKLLNINRGNRFVSLVSVASRAEGLKEYVKEHANEYPELQNTEFRQGDIVNTIITCADGTTVQIKLDTTLPRFYARDFTVRGTKGLYEQNTNLVFLDSGEEECYDPVEMYKKSIDNGKNYEAEYLPGFWKNLTEDAKKAGHGGMDYFQFIAFADALEKGEEMPIDVYDAACWMVITELSEKSIALGGAPIAFPDFTCGKWLVRPPKDVVEL